MSGVPRVLQVGRGGFGPTHLEAWCRLGFKDALWVADPGSEARTRAAASGVLAERIVADYREVLAGGDAVDVVAATDRHVKICLAAIAAGKDVFVEKPLTLIAGPAARGRVRAQRSHSAGRLLFSPSPAHLVR